MTSWSEGYVVDSAYTELAFPMLRPAHLSAVMVLNGQPPIELPSAGTYMDLGCGNGMTVATVAAACPSLDVWGCDFNPAHVARGRAIAARAGIGNCSFEECSFADMVADQSIGPREADVIVVHGVWSWVSLDVRRDLLRVIRERLAPGGVLFLSHLAPAGWEALAPYREYMRLAAAADGRMSVEVVPEIATMLRDLGERGVSFALSGAERSRITDVSQSDAAYLAHEHLNTHTHPQFADEVATELADAKCEFVGEVAPLPGSLSTLQPMIDSLDEPRRGDRGFVRVLADLWDNVGYYASVFRRGTVRLTPDEVAANVSSLRLVSYHAGRRDRLDTSRVEKASGLGKDRVLALLEEFDRGPTPIGSALSEAVPEDADAGLRAVKEALIRGIVGATISNEHDVSADVAGRLNRLLIDEVAGGRTHTTVSVPSVGGPLNIGPHAMNHLAETMRSRAEATPRSTQQDDRSLPEGEPGDWLPTLIDRLQVPIA